MVQSVRRSFFAVALLLAWGAAAPVAAAPILQVSGGILVGATGVNVNNTLYDVSFVDGSCITLYSGCDQVSDLPFTSATDANAASQALLDQVFVDGSSGNFDTTPSLIRGCSTQFCYAWTPYALTGLSGADFSIALNEDDGSDGLVTFSYFRGYDMAPTGDVMAVWTPAVPVPEPASMLLLGTGLLGAGVRRWRQRKA